MLGTAEKLVRLFFLWVVARFRGEVARLELLSHTNEHRGLVPNSILVNVNATLNEDVHGLVDRHSHCYALNAGVGGNTTSNAHNAHGRRLGCLTNWTDDGLIPQANLRLPLEIVAPLNPHAAKLHQLAVKRSEIAGEASGRDLYAIPRKCSFVESLSCLCAHGFAARNICLEGAGEETSRCRVR